MCKLFFYKYRTCFVSAEEFSSTAVPGRHRGVSQEQVFLSFCHLFRREGRRSLRGSPDISRSVATMLNNRCVSAPKAAIFPGLLHFLIFLMLLTDSNNKLPLFGRALRSEVKLDPLKLLGRKYKVTNGNERSCSFQTRMTFLSTSEGQQHAGRSPPGQRLPQRGQTRH